MSDTLSQHEKEKIIEEMRYRAQAARGLEPGRSPLAHFFAHPAVITVLGGIVVALLTTWFQYRSSSAQQELAFKQQQRDKKYELLAVFSEKFHRDITILYKLKDMKWWLGVTETNKTEELFNSTFTRNEVTTMYNALWKKYHDEDQALALLRRVRAMFTYRKVRDEADKLEVMVNTLDEMSLEKASKREREENLEKPYKEIRERTKRLIEAMADEINYPGDQR